MIDRVREAIGQEEIEGLVEDIGEDKLMALSIASSLEILKEIQDQLNKSIEGSEKELEELLEELEGEASQ